jgi:hypothetical protein
MKIGETVAHLSLAEEQLTDLVSPIHIFEIDLHAMREEAISDLHRLEREYMWQHDEMPVDNVPEALGPEYKKALSRKLVFSKIAAELATREGLKRMLDED